VSQDIIIVAVVHAPDARDLATVGATARDIMSEGALFARLVGEAIGGELNA